MKKPASATRTKAAMMVPYRMAVGRQNDVAFGRLGPLVQKPVLLVLHLVHYCAEVIHGLLALAALDHVQSLGRFPSRSRRMVVQFGWSWRVRYQCAGEGLDP